MTIATRNAFLYGMTESLGETAIAYSLTAARYTVLAYDFLTSDNAKATYKWVGGMTVALGQLAFWSVVWAYAKVSDWAEAEVQSCLPQPNEPHHVPDAENMVADPFHQPEMIAAIPAAMAPVATLTIRTALAYHEMTTTELRQECQKAGIKWRKVHGTRHLSKAEMIEALS
jgi:hypothetical protein